MRIQGAFVAGAVCRSLPAVTPYADVSSCCCMGRRRARGQPSATAGFRSKKLPGPYDFIGVLTSRLAPLWCICSGLPPVCALALGRLAVGQ